MDSLPLFLIHVAFAQVSNNNAPRISTHNEIPRDDPDNHTEHVPLEFTERLSSSLGQIFCIVLPVFDAIRG